MIASRPASRPESTVEPYQGRLWLVGVLAAATLVPVTMPVAVLRGLVHDRFGVSEVATSLFMSINMVGAVAATPLMGLLADRLASRKWLVIAASLADAALFVAMARAPTFSTLMAVRFVEGIAHMTALSVMLALLSDARTRKGPLMGMAGAGITFGVALGAPLGGALGRSSPVVPLYAGAIVLVVVAAFAAWLLVEPGRRAVRPTARDVWRSVSSDRALLIPLAYAFVDRFTTGFFTATFSLYLRRVFDAPPARIGLLIALFMLPFSVLSYPVGRASDRASRTRFLVVGSTLYGLATASLGWWPSGWLPLLMVTLGVTAAVMFVPSLLMTGELSGDALKATALYGFNAAGALGFIAGPMVGGWVSQSVAAWSTWHDGYRAAFLVAGGAELLCVALTLPSLMRLRREGRVT